MESHWRSFSQIPSSTVAIRPSSARDNPFINQLRLHAAGGERIWQEIEIAIEWTVRKNVIIGGYLLYTVLGIYALPVGFTKLYAWLMSSKTGVRFELSFAEVSKNFRHVTLFSTLSGVVLCPVDYFLPATPAFNLYVCAQLMLLIIFTLRMSCSAVVLPLGANSTGTRLAYSTMLATVILICQPAIYIGWAILRNG